MESTGGKGDEEKVGSFKNMKDPTIRLQIKV